ncbi:S8 family serine peptidase [Pseudochryseolinea flava]|uniref:Peptidase S8/S53 domain-containing protein n=1 Tax=Pseudochryseolinea flava TaxID=2059302 RepID=A0A364Y7W5_9BACT|nr:S8 family serine peptidase [Pseudochryseolinea flava]RAW02993.1 hypothetical protein DQQ10_02510 [Pseudochryseolinea flava]
MKFLGTTLLLIVMASVHMQAQPGKKHFTLPHGLTVDDYVPGKVLVKVKSKAIGSFTGGANGRMQSVMRTSKIRPLVPSIAQSSARLRTPKSPINIAQYFAIDFDENISVEAFINQLYETGNIEYAEPVFREKLIGTPNDIHHTDQYYLQTIRAYDAWDISEGSEDIIIAIIDSGVDINHPDLVDKIFINDDPVNGVDDDNNGYIDDYRGWDFSDNDNNPGIFKSGGGFMHGTAVGGCAGASTNNNIGISGVGYHSKLMFTKHFSDNQPANSINYSSDTYEGVLYAAQNGARIINCSWGSSFRSQVRQDIITYVTLEYNCLVIAAAGNDGVSAPLYPAAYDYVLSVAATNGSEEKAPFSNYGSTVDISAPGVYIVSTGYDDSYIEFDGTSFSAPIVAGAAALVMEHYPDLTALQVGELLRVTADKSFYDVPANADYAHGLGKGRLDIMAALTKESPAIRAMNSSMVNELGNVPAPGEKALVSFDFTNFLSASSAALTIKIETTSPHVSISKATVSPGAIASGVTVNNSENPFELTIDSNVPVDEQISLLITYEDGDYVDYQFFDFVPNPSFRTIEENLVTTSISSNGRIGFSDPSSSNGGNGFIFDDQSLLYEMGLIAGSSSSTLLNNVRNGSGGFDTDFKALNLIQKITPGERSSAEVFGDFSNSTDESQQKLKINYRSLVWSEEPLDKFVMLEYTITNTTNAPVSNFHFGIFADWDIDNNGAKDAAGWNEDSNLGYVYPKQSTTLPHAGVQLLSGNAKYYAIDNDQNVAGAPFGIYDGFSEGEKFTSIASNRLQAGTANGGNDVSHVVSSGPHNIPAGKQITVAFAIHAAKNLDDLIASAKHADTLYESITTVTDVESPLSNNLLVYPNPTRNQAITIEMEGTTSIGIEIELIDAKGQQLLKEQAALVNGSYATTIPTAHYVEGIYLVKVKTGNKIAVRKVVISK